MTAPNVDNLLGLAYITTVIKGPDDVDLIKPLSVGSGYNPETKNLEVYFHMDVKHAHVDEGDGLGNSPAVTYVQSNVPMTEWLSDTSGLNISSSLSIYGSYIGTGVYEGSRKFSFKNMQPNPNYWQYPQPIYRWIRVNGPFETHNFEIKPWDTVELFG